MLDTVVIYKISSHSAHLYPPPPSRARVYIMISLQSPYNIWNSNNWTKNTFIFGFKNLNNVIIANQIFLIKERGTFCNFLVDSCLQSKYPKKIIFHNNCFCVTILNGNRMVDSDSMMRTPDSYVSLPTINLCPKLTARNRGFGLIIYIDTHKIL